MKIAIIGDYDGRPSHVATNEAIEHASSILACEVDARWLPSTQFESSTKLQKLGQYDGIWGSAGDPHSGLGLVRAIQYARSNNIAYLGT